MAVPSVVTSAAATSGTPRAAVFATAIIVASTGMFFGPFGNCVHRSTTVTSPMFVLPPDTPEKTTAEIPGPDGHVNV